MTRNEFFLQIKELSLPDHQYVVVGSGLLAALGLREARDIDVAVLPKIAEDLRATGEYREEIRHNKSFLHKDDVEIITVLHWKDFPVTVEEAIESAIIIDGVRFLNIEKTIQFKEALGREKDERDIGLLREYKRSSA